MILQNFAAFVMTIALVNAVSAQPTEVTIDSLNVTQVGSVVLAEEGFQVVSDLYVAGSHAYVGGIDDGSGGALFIVDISQPANMRKVAEVTTDGPALDVKVDDGLAVVAMQGGSFGGIVVIDVTDPSMPQVLSQVSQPGGVHNLFLYKQRAYLAHAATPGLTILDLSDPSMPVQTGHWDNDTGFTNVVHDVFVRDDLAFISDFGNPGGLVILSLADPDNPVTISSVAAPEGTHSAWYERDHVYFSQEFGGWQRLLHIVDLSDPRRPVELPTFRARQSQPGQIAGAHNPWAEGDRLYWAYYDGGVRVFDISRPDRPVEIGYHTGPYSWGVQLHDDGLIYSTDMFNHRLMAFQFHEPGQMIVDASVTPGVAVFGQTLRVSVTATTATSPHGDGSGVASVTATFLDTDLPSVALHDDGGEADGLAGDGVFAARFSLPAGLPSGAYRIRVELMDTSGLIYPFDLSFDLFPAGDLVVLDEVFPVGWEVEAKGGAETPEFTSDGPVFRGQRAAAFQVDPASFVGWNVIFTPPQPVRLFGYRALRFAFHPGDTEGNALNLVVGGRSAKLVTRNNDGLVDGSLQEWQEVELLLSDLEVTEPIGAISFNGSLSGTFYLDDLRLVSDGPSPITAVIESRDQSMPGSFSLFQNYPNPFNPETTIRFDLPQSQEIELAVYNLTAQRVATLVHGRREAGSYSVQWDGRNDDGLELASGVYFYRLTAAEQVETRKLLLLR